MRGDWGSDSLGGGLTLAVCAASDDSPGGLVRRLAGWVLPSCLQLECGGMLQPRVLGNS